MVSSSGLNANALPPSVIIEYDGPMRSDGYHTHQFIYVGFFIDILQVFTEVNEHFVIEPES